ncbi:hypothetical protein L1987_82077 [Smallanthus sonchifolius]|uniref:Uncharacterized protein n=1 Tax=Smallanthus sonchifolius TaxID=185202 RepID=A0ACB8YTG0_9ASTR|nr:hypothetical protein L1987_82077 [Smallanthus sonchifolius]
MYDEILLKEDEMGSSTLEDYSDIMFEHLNELVIIEFSHTENELDFVKLILAKSPVLKKVSIFPCHRFDMDEEPEISKILLSSPCASPVVKFIVGHGKSSITNLCFVDGSSAFSPNLEKLKLEISVDDLFDESEKGSVTLEDYSDFMLEHLNELEILHFSNEDNELAVVKLLFAKSPVLKKARILIWDEFEKDAQLGISEVLLSFPCSSPVVKISFS